MKTKKANFNPLRTRPKTPEVDGGSPSEIVAASPHARSAPVLQFIMDMGKALQAAASVDGKAEPT